MQIRNILSGLSDAALAARSGGSGPRSNSASEAQAASALSSADLAGTAAAREILQQYDVQQITPRQFSMMLDELRQAGSLSEAEFQDLNLVRHELDRQGADPDEPLDLLEFLEEQMKQLQASLDEPELAADGNRQRQLAEMLGAVENRRGWLEKFSLMHEHGQSLGVDALA